MVPEAVVTAWMARFSECLQRRDTQSITSLFFADGWLRDFLVFQWDLRTLHGHDKISTYLSTNPHKSWPSSFRVASDEYFKPSPGLMPETVTAGFTFLTPIANGRGFVSLAQSDTDKEWKASIVFLTLDSLKGHEEIDVAGNLYTGRLPTWSEARGMRWKTAETQPDVLIIGAGQNGLQIAARFRQMQISTLVVERNDRVGDNWRSRYPALMLHTPKEHHTWMYLLYQPFPANWPVWTPGDKLADWLEQYSVSQDLLVWTKSTVVPFPVYNQETRKWTVTVDKAGERVAVHPTHIIVATGTLGEPYMPTFKDQNLFKGQILHSATFPGGSDFSGKRCVVIGTGISGPDIALDLSIRGAHSVTIVQRSSTCVQPGNIVTDQFRAAWPSGIPVEVSDFRFFATPMRRLFEILSSQRKHGETWEQEKLFIEQLQKAGIKLDLGYNDAGALAVIYTRWGGYWVDVGSVDQIISGNIQVKSGVQIQKFSDTSVTFDDGSTLEADVVIFATGYQGMEENLKTLLGDHTISQTKLLPCGIIDEEGEIPAGYRPTGHPGLWFAPGTFPNSRLQSKYLGIQIQALKLGYMNA
ncbi:FAD/NAD-P-binding domain-containing protein [Rhodocollybia butyracea]|uniref:FAD/NAD-P-binding domain-containing protein n=1 Tax=Rhodocollybia butyracea TaxID=206335 RepID=A0A9P5PJI8_9AGAR|nr:FAD/NAD-P-binding domain-containing protein [Rhodocollybia butyracea]